MYNMWWSIYTDWLIKSGTLDFVNNHPVTIYTRWYREWIK